MSTQEAGLAYLPHGRCSSLSLFLICGSLRTACGAASAGALPATVLVSLELHMIMHVVEPYLS